MILAIDVFYYSPEDWKSYTVSGVKFKSWESIEPEEVTRFTKAKTSDGSTGLAPYVSGKFKERELPCILEFIKHEDLRNIDTIIIDGYVILVNNELESIDTLGTSLYSELCSMGYGHISVVGIAKTKYRDETMMTVCVPVLRGDAINPIYVTAAGWINSKEAAEKVMSMAGEHRLPELIKLTDKCTKNCSI